jgi:hypothetical protein
MEFHPTESADVPQGIESHEPEARPSYAEAFAFFGHLAYRVRPLRETLAAHLLETDGEMLPHLLMQDVLEWLLEQVVTAPGQQSRTALDILDEAYRTGSDALRLLIVVSFVEAIPGFDGDPSDPGGRGRALRVALGPALSVELANLEQQRRGGAAPQG